MVSSAEKQTYNLKSDSGFRNLLPTTDDNYDEEMKSESMPRFSLILVVSHNDTKYYSTHSNYALHVNSGVMFQIQSQHDTS